MDAHPRARWPRPVPLIGDPTRAAERAADPSGWAFDEASVSALHAVIGARRDVRRYRADPVPPETPAPGARRRAQRTVGRPLAALALRRRHRAGDPRPGAPCSPTASGCARPTCSRPTGAPACSTCSSRASARRPSASSSPATGAPRRPGVLGRATFPDTDLWSCACAIQNLWLAARAERPGHRLGDAVPARRSRRAAAPARRRGDPRLALPGLARRAAARAGAGAARLVGAPRRSTTSSSPSGGPSDGEPARAGLAPGRPGPGGGRGRAGHRRRPARRARLARRARPRGRPGARAARTCRRAPARSCSPAPTTRSRPSGSRPTRRRSPPTCSPPPRAGESLGAAAARQAGLARRGAPRRPGSADPGDLLHADAHDGRPPSTRWWTRAGHWAGSWPPPAWSASARWASATPPWPPRWPAPCSGSPPEDAVGLGSGADAAMLDRKRAVVVRRSRPGAGASTARRWPSRCRPSPRSGGPEFALLTGVTLGAAAGGRAGRPRRARHLARGAGRRPPGAGGAVRAGRRATAAASGRTPPSSPSSASSRCSTCACGRGRASAPAWPRSCCSPRSACAGRRGGPREAAPPAAGARARRCPLGQVAVRRGAAVPAARTSTTSPAARWPTAPTPSGTTGWPLHRARRPASWRTLETVDLPAVLRSPGPPVLLDCLSTWLARDHGRLRRLDRRRRRRRPAGRGGRRGRRGLGARRPAGDRGEQRGRQRRRAGHPVRTAVPRRARRAQRADRRPRPTGSGC